MQKDIESVPRRVRPRVVGAMFAAGMLLCVQSLAAQQNAATPEPAPEDSATCTAMESYLTGHRKELQQTIVQRVTQLMERPGMEQALTRLMQTAVQQAQDPKAGRSKTASVSVGHLDFSVLPETTRRAVGRALKSGQFDSAKTLLLPTLGNDSLKTLSLDLSFTILASMPDSLRSLLSGSLERGATAGCGVPGVALEFEDDSPLPWEEEPSRSPVTRSDSTPPNHP